MTSKSMPSIGLGIGSFVWLQGACLGNPSEHRGADGIGTGRDGIGMEMERFSGGENFW
jgi:hypothetical protein